ncbi:hypothetical protein Daus18300_011965 [Diaporthe australafricana]|uniref:Uncharacterized protein n=1 Tax=Diaporthe australafricana TaxID=127596 RepID=A0ABR3W4J5_9PEZI
MPDTGTLLPPSNSSNRAAMDATRTVEEASSIPVAESERQAEGSLPAKDIQTTSNAEAPNQEATSATINDCPGDIVGPNGKEIEYGTNLHYEAGKSYPILSTNTPQQRRKQAVLRLAQSKAYAELIEERLVHLEKVLAELQPKVYFEQNFNDRLKHLERIHSKDKLVSDSEERKTKSEPAHQRAVQPNPEEMGPVKETDSVEARDQLRILCQMVDIYLRPKVILHKGLNPDTAKVAFHEWWYVFRPGTEVRTRDASQIQL